MDKASLIFCGGSISVCILLAFFAYPHAALSISQVERAKSVVAAEQLDVIDLGEFGEVLVSDLIDYYIDNPPEPVAAGTAVKRVRFEGC